MLPTHLFFISTPNSRPPFFSSTTIRQVFRYILGFVFFFPACAADSLHSSSSPPGASFVQAFDGSPRSVKPNLVRLNPSVCEKLDLRQDYGHLDYLELDLFLKRQGFSTRLTLARPDLVYLDLLNAGTSAPIRLRIAVLPNAPAAGRDLHQALLEHGTGFWGIHRSNLAILAPSDNYDDIVAFAARTKLACFGVLTIAGLDDTFVVPGGYSEL